MKADVFVKNPDGTPFVALFGRATAFFRISH